MTMTAYQLKNIASRAAWTAAQAFLATFAVADLGTAKSALIAAAAAALSVLKTFVSEKAQS
jgi:hypothetical protein